MAATKTTKSKAPAEKAKKAPKAEAAGKKATKASDKPRKLSALDAAAKVLGESEKPMNCKEMIDAMAAKGYWKSPGGATPWATLLIIAAYTSCGGCSDQISTCGTNSPPLTG